MITITTPPRGSDSKGSGHFGAPRGSRTHTGIDYAAWPGSYVHAKKPGKVTKLGYAYADDLGWRYVEVTDENSNRVRYFYVKPSVAMGDSIQKGDIIGLVQDLTLRYRGITPHIHVEVKTPNNEYVNPEEYLGV